MEWLMRCPEQSQATILGTLIDGKMSMEREDCQSSKVRGGNKWQNHSLNPLAITY